MNEIAGGEICVREGRLDDLDAVIALERATEFAPHWPRTAYVKAPQAQTDSVRRYLVVAERLEKQGESVLGRLVGFAVMAVVDDSAELESVAVAVTERGAGIGMELGKAAVEWARGSGVIEVTLEVRSQSQAALPLYRRLGFVESARRPRYYADPEDDAVLMRLPLMPSSGR